jgi:hypothetical protein
VEGVSDTSVSAVKANCCNAADLWVLRSVREESSISDQPTLIVDIVADSAALIIPLRLLVVLQDKWLRTRLMAIFSTCMITTAVSIVHAIFILRSRSPAIVIIALVEVSVSLPST